MLDIEGGPETLQSFLGTFMTVCMCQMKNSVYQGRCRWNENAVGVKDESFELNNVITHSRHLW